MAEGGISPEEYRRWHSPKRALVDLLGAVHGLTNHDAKTRLLEALATGAVSAACYRNFSRVVGLAGGESEAEFIRIPRTAWARGYDPQDALWDDGNANFETFGNKGPFAVFDVERECIGVRFEPIGVELLVEHLAPVAPMSPGVTQVSRVPPPIKPLEISRGYNPRPVGTLDQIAPELAAFGNVPNNVPATQNNVPKNVPVTDAEVLEWHASLSPEIGGLAVRKLRLLARDHFAPRRVAKNLTEQFGIGRPKGRRPKDISIAPKD